uniref:Uncharacterized protein n=1 Tax=Eutreptiella gymnastica TaxID=73025 RepID=A0A6T1RKZ7_9EUGL
MEGADHLTFTLHRESPSINPQISPSNKNPWPFTLKGVEVSPYLTEGLQKTSQCCRRGRTLAANTYVLALPRHSHLGGGLCVLSCTPLQCGMVSVGGIVLNITGAPPATERPELLAPCVQD